jgi:hypothetical protein
LDVDFTSLVASSEKFFHDATNSGLGRVVRNGEDDGLTVIQDVGLAISASRFGQGVNESRKNFGLNKMIKKLSFFNFLKR